MDRVYHMDRGYERFDEKLASVGARIRRSDTKQADEKTVEAMA